MHPRLGGRRRPRHYYGSHRYFLSGSKMRSSLLLVTNACCYMLFTNHLLGSCCQQASALSTDAGSTPTINSNNGVRELAKTGIRYRARVAYDGSGFSGWQTQQDQTRTVQGELESILSQRFDRKIRIVGSGRTDTGVHARGQAMHFDLEDELPLDEDKKLEYCINSMLRRDVRVWNVGIAPESLLVTDEQGNVLQHKWHAIVSSKSKLYSYRFATTHYLDPIDRHYRSHFYESFNINQFQKLMQEYVGTRNFRAFAGAIEANEKRKGKAIGTVRTVTKIDLITEGEGKYRLDIYLEGALYKMVRNMVGTVLAVCTGKIDEETFMSFVHQPLDEDTSERVYARDDNLAKPAPPQGLTLECVFFDDHDDF